jgi:hypothetical protein
MRYSAGKPRRRKPHRRIALRQEKPHRRIALRQEKPHRRIALRQEKPPRWIALRQEKPHRRKPRRRTIGRSSNTEFARQRGEQ